MADTAAPAQVAGTDAAVAAVLALHAPARRYKASFRDTVTFPTAQRAFEVNLEDSMRGYESIPLEAPEDAESVEVCAECSRIENAALLEAVLDCDPEHDDEADGTELSLDAAKWPCPTVAAITATPAGPKE